MILAPEYLYQIPLLFNGYGQPDLLLPQCSATRRPNTVRRFRNRDSLLRHWECLPLQWLLPCPERNFQQ